MKGGKNDKQSSHFTDFAENLYIDKIIIYSI